MATRPLIAAIHCPGPDCRESFECEACIHQHLVAEHGLRYGEVFGPQDAGMLDLCSNHAELTASALGI